MPGTFPSFWSEECLYMDKDFSFGRAIGLTSALRFSPFLSLDPQVAFLIAQADQKVSFCRGIGALGAIGLHFFTRDKLIFGEESKKLDQYVSEYLLKNPFTSDIPFEQVVVFGDDQIDLELWKKLPVGGTYILGCNRNTVRFSGITFEAFGKLWPYGEATEFGWKFQEEELGLNNFYFFKIKKSGR